MKVLILSAAKSIHTIKWVNAMAKKGHKVFLAYNKGHEPKEDMIDKKVTLYCMKQGGIVGYYLNARELARYVKQIQPDVINVHYASGYGTLARMAKIEPYLLSVWGSDVYDFPYESHIKKSILHKNINYADALASTSNCMARQLLKVMGNEDIEIAVTPFGVDTNLFDPAKYEIKNSDSEIVIGNIKALEPKYGIKELIISFAKLKDIMEKEVNFNKKLKLEIYGNGSQKEELLKLIDEKNLQNSVFLKGRIPNVKVAEALKGFDIFCALSQWNSESFGVAIVEAMAMEKPVVVSDVDGFMEVVEDGKTGYIVPRNNIDSVVARLKELVLDAEKRKNMGENGRKRVKQLYDWENNVTTMENTYKTVIRG